MDNASGCAEVLAIAKAFAALPQRPRRSILIAFVAGRGAGPARLAVPGDPPARAGRPDRREHQLRRRQRPRPHARRHPDRPRQVLARRDRASDRRPPGAQAAWATSSPTAASSTAPTSSASPRSACRRSTRKAGTDYIGKPAGWGKEQAEEYEQHRYHQPSDEFDPKWIYDGMIEDAQLGFYTGLVVATQPRRCRPGTPATSSRRRARSRWPRSTGRGSSAAFPHQTAAFPRGKGIMTLGNAGRLAQVAIFTAGNDASGGKDSRSPYNARHSPELAHHSPGWTINLSL